MNMNDIAWHLQNFGDTWSGWGNVLQSLAELFSQAWRDALARLIEAFGENGPLNPANNENKELSSALTTTQPQLDDEGKYQWNGLSSFGKPRN